VLLLVVAVFSCVTWSVDKSECCLIVKWLAVKLVSDVFILYMVDLYVCVSLCVTYDSDCSHVSFFTSIDHYCWNYCEAALSIVSHLYSLSVCLSMTFCDSQPSFEVKVHFYCDKMYIYAKLKPQN